jgi:hypothetical protein
LSRIQDTTNKHARGARVCGPGPAPCSQSGLCSTVSADMIEVIQYTPLSSCELFFMYGMCPQQFRGSGLPKPAAQSLLIVVSFFAWRFACCAVGEPAFLAVVPKNCHCVHGIYDHMCDFADEKLRLMHSGSTPSSTASFCRTMGFQASCLR